MEFAKNAKKTHWQHESFSLSQFTLSRQASGMPQPAHNEQIPERRKNSNDENSYIYD